MADHEATPIVLTISDLPDPAPCCQQAHERGYRRGYRDGYTYAAWDIGRVTRAADRIIEQVEDFRATTLVPWVRKAYDNTATSVSRIGAPRFRFQRAKKTVQAHE